MLLTFSTHRTKTMKMLRKAHKNWVKAIEARLFLRSRVVPSKLNAIIQQYQELYPLKDWNFPKNHTHSHGIEDIWRKGVTKNFNTKPFEKMHGQLKKIYLRQTNFRDVDDQVWFLVID